MDTISRVSDRRVLAGGSWLQRPFWFVGGFDSVTLARAECRAVRSKYSSMGALVLLTALLASCSGGYAIYTIFHDWRVTAALGALWGLMILALDRFLVSSARKHAVLKDFNKEPLASPPYSQHGSQRILAVRLPLALVIGVVVSAPIDMRLMQPWIQDYERGRYETRMHDIEKDPGLDRLEREIAVLEASRVAKEARVDEMAQGAAQEAAGTGGSLKRNKGPIWETEDGYLQSARKELEDIKSQLQHAREEHTALWSRLVGTVERDFTQRAQERSIISDLAIIPEIAAVPGPKGHAVWVISGFLTLLFALIECIPVLAKAMSPFDVYEAVVQEIEEGGILDALVETRRRYAEASLSE